MTRTAEDPRVETVAAALYEHPSGWMRHDPDWSAASEAAREPWRAEAARVLAVLDTAGVMCACHPEPTTDRRTP